MIEEKLSDIFQAVLHIDLKATDEDAKFRDMESWDSMTFMMLIVRTEESFGITLTDQEIIDFDCIKTAIRIIKSKLSK